MVPSVADLASVSIHVPVKGTTLNFERYDLASAKGFNPRPREGDDDHESSESTMIHGVSIHVPVKGRRTKTFTGTCPRCFNPRPREGDDSHVLRVCLHSG